MVLICISYMAHVVKCLFMYLSEHLLREISIQSFCPFL
jgi:hypothetical protein